MRRVGCSENILVPRGMNDLAKTPRPLAPALRISYIGVEREGEDWRWDCFGFEHGLRLGSDSGAISGRLRNNESDFVKPF